MKTIFLFIPVFVLISCVQAKDLHYSGSTPADTEVRDFLGINLLDSVDFIRWKIVTTEDMKYTLECSYGIGKPGTTGFYNNGKHIKLSGRYQRNGNRLLFNNGSKQLQVAILNESLLHILNHRGELMLGTGGWSYTLNNDAGNMSSNSNLKASSFNIINDSVVFQGRTPCRGFDQRPDCYKKKWLLTFYTDKNNSPTFFRTGTAKFPGIKGSWSVIRKIDGRIIYQLQADSGESFHLLKIDENILVFTDDRDRLFVGDGDYSYTLSKVY